MVKLILKEKKINETTDGKKVIEDAAANLRKFYPLLQQIKKDLQSASSEKLTQKELELYNSIIKPVSQDMRALLKLNRETIRNAVKAKDPDLGMDIVEKKFDEVTDKVTPAVINFYKALKQIGGQNSKTILTFIHGVIEAEVLFYQDIMKLYDEFNVNK